MFDEVFGEVTYDYDGYIAVKEIEMFAESCEIEVHINCDEGEEISQGQREVFEELMNSPQDMQHRIAAAILKYYNEVEKGAYGPDDPEEFARWWPDIDSEEELAGRIHLDTIYIWSDYNGKNPLYVLFDRDWGGEDTEDNGVAVGIEDGEVTEVGYKDIAL